MPLALFDLQQHSLTYNMTVIKENIYIYFLSHLLGIVWFWLVSSASGEHKKDRLSLKMTQQNEEQLKNNPIL